MAVTLQGIPVRLWTFPGNTCDQTLIRTVKDDLRSWQLHRVVWVLDRGFTSEDNRRYLQRAGGSYILGEKLRGAPLDAQAALGRQGRYRTVDGSLRVKQVHVDSSADRFVVCHNPDRAAREAEVRDQIVARLQQRIEGSDGLEPRARAELAGKLKTRPAYARFLRAPPTGKLRVDRAAVRRDAHYDGKYLLRTPDRTLTPDDIAHADKALYQAERGWRDLKTVQIHLRPVFHHKEQRIRAHLQLCWLALLLRRVAETAAGEPGATSATSSTASTWSPSPPPTGTSPSAPPSPPASAPSSRRWSWPSRPGSSTSRPPATDPPRRPAARPRRCSHTRPIMPRR